MSDDYRAAAPSEFEGVRMDDDRDYYDPDPNPDFTRMTPEKRWQWAEDWDLAQPARVLRQRRLMDWEYDQRGPHAAAASDARADRDARPLFADVATILDGGLRAPVPDGGPKRTDGAQVFYRGKANALIGDPESAKTLLALCVVAAELLDGGVGVFIDTDHNGPDFVLGFLLSLGVTRDALVDRMKYADPEDRDELLRIVDAITEMDPCAVVLDSVGENLSLWGVSSNDDQGVIDMNRATAAKLAKAGHLVITIDHLAKNTDSRKFGATGSTAKKRAVDGAMYQVVIITEFSPDDGGKSALILKKDRTGGVRALGYKRDETVAVFEVTAPDRQTGTQSFVLHPGTLSAPAATAAATKAAGLAADVAALAQLTPPPKSKTDVMARMTWGSARAMAALQAWRSQTPSTGGQP